MGEQRSWIVQLSSHQDNHLLPLWVEQMTRQQPLHRFPAIALHALSHVVGSQIFKECTMEELHGWRPIKTSKFRRQSRDRYQNPIFLPVLHKSVSLLSLCFRLE